MTDDTNYTVVTSMQGSSFRFDGTNPNSPPPGPHKTLEEAVLEARGFIVHTDTFGGDAQVVHVDTLEIVWPEEMKGQVFQPIFGKVPDEDKNWMQTNYGVG